MNYYSGIDVTYGGIGILLLAGGAFAFRAFITCTCIVISTIADAAIDWKSLFILLCINISVEG